MTHWIWIKENAKKKRYINNIENIFVFFFHFDTKWIEPTILGQYGIELLLN
jgi:hypothetical protein